MQHERMLAELDLGNVIGDDARAEVFGLLPHKFHQFGAADAVAAVRRHHLALLLDNRRVDELTEVAGREAGRVGQRDPGQIECAAGRVQP